jgi:hypothetical protein
VLARTALISVSAARALAEYRHCCVLSGCPGDGECSVRRLFGRLLATCSAKATKHNHSQFLKQNLIGLLRADRG